MLLVDGHIHWFVGTVTTGVVPFDPVPEIENNRSIRDPKVYLELGFELTL
jgi:hypothetical protein